MPQSFQEACRTPEWRAALIVYEKYKRKFNLEFEDLVRLRNFVVDFTCEREIKGLKVNKELLVQFASAEVKKYKKE